MEKLAQNIQRHRERMKLSQQDVADLVGKTRQTVSHWENNGNSKPDAADLMIMAKKFGVSVSELLGEEVNANFNIDKHPLVIELRQEIEGLKITLNNILRTIGGSLGKSELCAESATETPIFTHLVDSIVHRGFHVNGTR